MVGPLQGPEAYGTTRSIGLWFSKLVCSLSAWTYLRGSRGLTSCNLRRNVALLPSKSATFACVRPNRLVLSPFFLLFRISLQDSLPLRLTSRPWLFEAASPPSSPPARPRLLQQQAETRPPLRPRTPTLHLRLKRTSQSPRAPIPMQRRRPALSPRAFPPLSRPALLYTEPIFILLCFSDLSPLIPGLKSVPSLAEPQAALSSASSGRSSPSQSHVAPNATPIPTQSQTPPHLLLPMKNSASKRCHL